MRNYGKITLIVWMSLANLFHIQIAKATDQKMDFDTCSEIIEDQVEVATSDGWKKTKRIFKRGREFTMIIEKRDNKTLYSCKNGRLLIDRLKNTRIDNVRELQLNHNHGMACNYYLYSESPNLKEKIVATQIWPQKRMWMNFGEKDISFKINDIIENGLAVGFSGDIDETTHVDGRKTKTLEEKDGMPQDEYKILIKNGSYSHIEMKLISRCDP